MSSPIKEITYYLLASAILRSAFPKTFSFMIFRYTLAVRAFKLLRAFFNIDCNTNSCWKLTNWKKSYSFVRELREYFPFLNPITGRSIDPVTKLVFSICCVFCEREYFILLFRDAICYWALYCKCNLASGLTLLLITVMFVFYCTLSFIGKFCWYSKFNIDRN